MTQILSLQIVSYLELLFSVSHCLNVKRNLVQVALTHIQVMVTFRKNKTIVFGCPELKKVTRRRENVTAAIESGQKKEKETIKTPMKASNNYSL